MLVKELTTQCLEKILNEVKKEENMNKIQQDLMDPLIQYTYKRIYPYFLITIVIFLLTFILALLIFIILVKKILKTNS
jgi:hypothetical protein